MIGKPKYKLNEMVSFSFGDDTYSGTIEVVDKYGVFEDNSDVHYDILVDNYKGSPCLFKHIIESDVKNNT